MNSLLCKTQYDEKEANQARYHQRVVDHTMRQEADDEGGETKSNPKGAVVAVTHHSNAVFNGFETDKAHNQKGNDAAFQQQLEHDVVSVRSFDADIFVDGEGGLGAGAIAK